MASELYNAHEVEDLSLYRPGGLFPIGLGNNVTSSSPALSYCILQKLGHGPNSTVWLARDNLSSRLVALKIHAAFASPSKFLRRIPSHPFILEYTHTFTAPSPNGVHIILVSQPHGPSLADTIANSPQGRLKAAAARQLVPQLVKAVAKMHYQNIAHGNINTGNLLFKLPGFECWTPERVLEVFGLPVVASILPANPHKPEYVLRPTHPANLLPYCTRQLILCGFSNTYTVPRPLSSGSLSTNVFSVAPEVLLKQWDEVDLGSDIWALACTIFRICSDRPLFSSDGLADIVAALGGLPTVPQRWWTTQGWTQPVETDILWRRLSGPAMRGVGEGLEEVEIRALNSVLSMMVKWEPQRRIGVEEVLGRLPEGWVITDKNEEVEGRVEDDSGVDIDQEP